MAWGMEHRASRKTAGRLQQAAGRNRLIKELALKHGALIFLPSPGIHFESREFLILSVLASKTMILGLKTAIFGTIIIARIFNESPAATTTPRRRRFFIIPTLALNLLE